MDSSQENELLRRLRALEEENARLREVKKGEAPKKLTITETDYNGHPMLQFQRGNRRPFSLGIRKLEDIREGWEQIQAFLAKHGQDPSESHELQI